MLYVIFGNEFIQQPGAGSISGFLLLEDTSFVLLEDGTSRIAFEGA